MLIAMLATDCGDIDRLSEYVGDDAWALEQKIDGRRQLVVATEVGHLSYNRRGERTDMPRAIATMAPLPPGFVLDGELLDDHFWVFDLAMSPLTTTGSALHERRLVLDRLFELWQPGPAVSLLPQATTVADKAELVNKVVDVGGEGFVAKHLDGRYEPGRRSTRWQKVKLTSCADVVVTAVSPDGRENYEVAVFSDDGTMRSVAAVAWNHRRSGGLLAPGDVVEVRYLYTGVNGRLVQPRLVRRRTDKTPEECRADQLRDVNKEVVA